LLGTIGNLLGVGDILALQYGRSEGLDDGGISYSLPISSDDTRVSFRYDINSTLVVAQDLGPLNITGRYNSIGIGLSRPFYRTPEQTLTLGLSLERRQSQTFLLGEPFSFVAGAENGRTNVTVLRFYQDWLDRNAERVLALRSTFSLGVHALGATVTRTPPSGQFFAWLGQAQYVRRIHQDWEVLVRGSLQLSNDSLFPIEQFVLGGLSTVRGYREYLTATDNAFVGTFELRVPIGKLSVPRLSASADDGAVQLVPLRPWHRLEHATVQAGQFGSGEHRAGPALADRLRHCRRDLLRARIAAGGFRQHSAGPRCALPNPHNPVLRVRRGAPTVLHPYGEAICSPYAVLPG